MHRSTTLVSRSSLSTISKPPPRSPSSSPRSSRWLGISTLALNSPSVSRPLKFHLPAHAFPASRVSSFCGKWLETLRAFFESPKRFSKVVHSCILAYCSGTQPKHERGPWAQIYFHVYLCPSCLEEMTYKHLFFSLDPSLLLLWFKPIPSRAAFRPSNTCVTRECQTNM